MIKNRFILFSLSITIITTAIISCEKKEIVPVVSDPSFTEGFDSLSKAISTGWVVANNSRPLGTLPWVQGFFYLSQNHQYDGKLGASDPYQYDGIDGMPGPQSGADFVMATANSGHGKATISNWLISPEVMVKNGDKISFYTRSYLLAPGADRLQVRVNTVNGSADVGRDALSVGNFSEVLLDINPDYIVDDEGEYPGEWTLYDVTVSGMPGSTAKRSRIAFRYFVEDGGPTGTNSFGIGIDNFKFVSVK